MNNGENKQSTLDSAELLNKGESLFESDPVEALKTFQSVLELDAKNLSAWNHIGRLLFSMQAYQDSENAFLQVATIAGHTGQTDWSELGQNNAQMARDAANTASANVRSSDGAHIEAAEPTPDSEAHNSAGQKTVSQAEAPVETYDQYVADIKKQQSPPTSMPLRKVLFGIHGRIDKSQYWKAQILALPMYLVGVVLISAAAINENQGNQPELISIPLNFLGLLFMYPTYAIFIKRFHDLSRSGWHALLAAIPMVYFIVLFYLGSKNGSPGKNKYDQTGRTDIKAPSYMTEGSYIWRHWRGYFNLATSFWGNMVFATLFFSFPFSMLLLAIGEPSGIWGIVGFSVLSILVFVAVVIWQSAGLWRAAGTVMKFSDRKFWPIVSRVVAVVWFGLVATLVFERAGILSEQIKIALGDGELGQRSYAILQNGRELVISGGVSYGLVEEVERKLENNQDIQIIRLHGPGGRIGPARRLRKIIEQRKMTTYVRGECHSACTMIFLGGSKRVLHKFGKLGFHRLSFPGMKPHELKPEINVERRYMAMRGIPEKFIDKVFSTPASDIWVPSHARLLKSSYVSRITNGNDFGSVPGKISKLAQFEQKMLTTEPAFAAMKRYEKPLYDAFWQKARSQFLGGQSELDYAELRYRYLRKAEAQTIAETSNKAALDLAKARLNKFTYARDKSPVLCAKLMGPQKFGILIENLYLPYDITHAESKALAHVIADKHNAPLLRTNKEAIGAVMKELNGQALQQFGRDKLAKIQKIRAFSAREFGPRCAFSTLTLKITAQMKAEKVGPAYRYTRAIRAPREANLKFKRATGDLAVPVMHKKAAKGSPAPADDFAAAPTIADYVKTIRSR